MATTQNTYTGDGSTTNYSFTFEYIKQADVKVTLDTVATTAYTFANATTLSFTTAPTSGAAIRIYRDTEIDTLNATFFPGSAIKAEDLNNNFTQTHFAVQEADFEVDTANTTADTAKTTADTALTNSATAITTANAATTTANTADTNASAAVVTANAASASATTASTNAASAVTTANTASTNASAAVVTANAADANATTALTNSRESDGSGGFTTAISKANTALTTANSASTNATAAVSTANTADTNATAAVNTANAASAAVSSAVLFTLIANVAAIPGSPSNNDYVEIGNSTGIESFSPLSSLPSGFVGASGLTVRLRYDSSTSSWVWMNYFANDSEDRYLTKPSTAGTSGYVLKTDGSGTNSWGGADVVFDTTPQLGGDLDVNGHEIVSGGSNTDINITAARHISLSVNNNSNSEGRVTVSGRLDANSVGTEQVLGTTPTVRGSSLASLSTIGNLGNSILSRFEVGTNELDLYFGSSSEHHLTMQQSGDFSIMNTTSSQRGIAFYGGTTNNFLTIRPPSSFTATTYYLPAADGTANQVLTTDGSGNMSWSNGGSPTIDAGNFDSGGSLVTTSQTFDGGSFD